MSDIKIRLSELAKIQPFAGKDHRHLINAKGKLPFVESLPRKERRMLADEAKHLARKYTEILKGLAQSGAKFPADKILREFATEYTHRYASSGIYNQPVSFNYFEPFLHIKLMKELAPYAEIEQEFNHLFHAEDYFDYVTSRDSDEFHVSTLLDLPQDQIFHFSTCGEVTETSFLNGEGREFVVSGFSMIRRGNSLHWYLIGGEALGQEEWQLRCSEQPKVDLENVTPWKRAFLAESIAEAGNQRGKPKHLEGTDTYIRTVIAGEFDIKEEKHLSRCYLEEYEHSFNVICDDPEVLAPFNENEHKERLITTMNEHFKRSAVLWSLAEGLFQLPKYFSARFALNKDTQNKTHQRIPKKKGGKGLSGEYVVIPALETNTAAPTSTITMVNLPHYEIETEGHWKRLSNEEGGVDRHGNPVRGRTWVASSSKWKPTGSASTTIYLKDTLAAAKLKISEYLDAVGKVNAESGLIDSQAASDEGELYIMRCSAMKEQIFKVGFTSGTSIERARQLSSATGVPLAFTVVKQWRHKDARKLETEVHMMLSPYRLNDGREFFMAKYDVIEKAVESAIKRTG
ncbi:MAG: GIY-YIG nuclease family protein [Gallionella sp.]|nr:GIY-YIG nuclease family protein [Gallionella sp.]